jgi:Cytochrome C and Quinol oxidase polypeptide I
VPALFYGAETNYTVVDAWRFWIIHLWVEGFFEFFVTVMFYEMGLVRRITALRTIYLDAILYFGGGLIGTGHHWYWTGQTELNMAFSATFSALEVVPLVLITLDAWDFVRVTRGSDSIVERHRWTFYFLMAVGFWNFLGAGVFGFLINTPVVSYYEVGTILTPNHGHAAMMGVFGMLGAGLMVFVLREVADNTWRRLSGLVRLSFWGLEHRFGDDGVPQPVSGRHPAGAGCGRAWLLARAQPRLHRLSAGADAGMAAHAWRSGLHVRWRGAAHDRHGARLSIALERLDNRAMCEFGTCALIPCRGIAHSRLRKQPLR